jgi:hypothetical protein
MTPWWTTVDVRRALRISGEGVRWLVRRGRLEYERTRSGQYLFREDDVRRLLHERAERRLATIRPRMLRAPTGPRQLPLFSAQVMRFRPPRSTWGSQSEDRRDRSRNRAS